MRKTLTPGEKKILQDRQQELMPERQSLVQKSFREGLDEKEKERLREIHSELDDIDMALYGPMFEDLVEIKEGFTDLASRIHRLQEATEKTIRVYEKMKGDPVKSTGFEDGFSGEEPTSQSLPYLEAYRAGKEIGSLWKELEENEV